MVEVWQEPSQFWRWRYLEPPGDGTSAVELISNEVYDRREEAVEAAMTAYPGVSVRELGAPPGTAERAERASGMRSRGRLLAVLGFATALLVWRWRRRQRQ